MKKKLEIRYDNEVGEDMEYYLQQVKKEAMKKAEEIFGESELPTKSNAEHFDMKDIYKTRKAKPQREKEKDNNNLKAVLEQIKKSSQKVATEIFNKESKDVQ